MKILNLQLEICDELSWPFFRGSSFCNRTCRIYACRGISKENVVKNVIASKAKQSQRNEGETIPVDIASSRLRGKK